MRFIGRLFSESSPAIFVVKLWPARIPESRRMVVPEFPASGYAHDCFLDFHFGAERFHATERAVAIGCQREVAQFSRAFRDARQHGVAVRDGFVAGRRHAARDCFCRMNRFFAQVFALGRPPDAYLLKADFTSAKF
jgi:hypothetical protein